MNIINLFHINTLVIKFNIYTGDFRFEIKGFQLAE